VKHDRSKEIFRRAEARLVGGVNSPVRAFRSVGGEPIIAARGEGSHIFDADGNSYIDYIGSWGALILGHANPAVTRAIEEQASRGTSFGVTNEAEVELAERICKAIPSIEKIRFVSSGTEATMSAVRLARAFTGRDLILKFDGCYHGHADAFLSNAGSGLATLGIAACPGVPEETASLTISVPYNDLAAVERAIEAHTAEIAAIIVEPIAANMGVVPPADGFLKGLRDLATRAGALLIFDEVITGFRLAYGGAQNIFGIAPDLTILGKIIGGGLPVAAYGARAEIMDRVAPLGAVYQAGTLSGNPLAIRAGIEMLKQAEAPGFYEELNKRSAQFVNRLGDALADCGVAGQLQSFGSLATLFFAPQPVANFVDAGKSDTSQYATFFRAMLERGVLLAPSQFEAMFVSAAHSNADFDATIAAARESLQICSTSSKHARAEGR
jgi:glutamate-1-semialdehyde 2,1-aminomutase